MIKAILGWNPVLRAQVVLFDRGPADSPRTSAPIRVVEEVTEVKITRTSTTFLDFSQGD